MGGGSNTDDKIVIQPSAAQSSNDDKILLHPSPSQSTKQCEPDILQTFDELWNGSKRKFLLLKIVVKGTAFTYRHNMPKEGRCQKLMAIDTKGNRIQIVAFGSVIDDVCSNLQEMTVYQVSNFSLLECTSANGKLDYTVDISFNSKTVLQPLPTDTYKFPITWFHFEKFDAVESYKETGYLFDLIGTVVDVNARQKHKTLMLLDNSGTIIKITIWADVPNQNILSEIQDNAERCLVAVTALKSTDYNGRPSISASSLTKIIKNPIHPTDSAFETWSPQSQTEISICSPAGTSTPKLHVPKKSLQLPQVTLRYAQQHKDQIGNMFSVYGHITHVTLDKDPWYISCLSCAKKVISNAESNLYCPKCKSLTPSTCLRYLLRTKISDWTDTVDATIFDNVAQVILQTSAEELSNSYDTIQQLQDELSTRLQQPFVFNMKRDVTTTKTENNPQYIVDSIEQLTLP